MFLIERGSVAVSIQGATGDNRDLTVLGAGAAFVWFRVVTPRLPGVRDAAY